VSPKNTGQRVRVPSPKEIATSSSASGNWISSVLYVGGHQEDFGAAGNSSPANPFLTSPARKSAKGKPTLAFLKAFTQAEPDGRYLRLVCNQRKPQPLHIHE